MLARGSAVHPLVFNRLGEAARANDIAYSVEAAPCQTLTDADAFTPSRAGIPTGLVSIPNRYMHSPNEQVSLDDLDTAARHG